MNMASEVAATICFPKGPDGSKEPAAKTWGDIHMRAEISQVEMLGKLHPLSGHDCQMYSAGNMHQHMSPRPPSI